MAQVRSKLATQDNLHNTVKYESQRSSPKKLKLIDALQANLITD